jgi:hypothetical protein
MWRGVALVLIAGCWTGPEQPAYSAPPTQPSHRARSPHHKFELLLERTPCFGRCPAYKLHVAASGTIEWLGISNVAVVGRRVGQALTPGQLDRIDHAIDNARFFEFDESGHLPVGPDCVRTGNAVSCSLSSFTMCSDTSHTVITIRRDGTENRVDNAHCSDAPAELDALETAIDDATGVQTWIGS